MKERRELNAFEEFVFTLRKEFSAQVDDMPPQQRALLHDLLTQAILSAYTKMTSAQDTHFREFMAGTDWLKGERIVT